MKLTAKGQIARNKVLKILPTATAQKQPVGRVLALWHINHQGEQLAVSGDLSTAWELALKKITPVCDCGQPAKKAWSPCCSIECWEEKFGGDGEA